MLLPFFVDAAMPMAARCADDTAARLLITLVRRA